MLALSSKYVSTLENDFLAPEVPWSSGFFKDRETNLGSFAFHLFSLSKSVPKTTRLLRALLPWSSGQGGSLLSQRAWLQFHFNQNVFFFSLIKGGRESEEPVTLILSGVSELENK